MFFLMKGALFLSRLLALYSFIIWIRIFLTWINPYPQPGSFTYYIAKIVDPYLSLFRSDKARIGALDFSPVIAVGILSVIESLLNVFGIYGTVTFGIILFGDSVAPIRIFCLALIAVGIVGLKIFSPE